MSVRDRFRTLFFCALLELGALAGMPMRPEEIRDLMQTFNQPKVTHTIPERTNDGDAEKPPV